MTYRLGSPLFVMLIILALSLLGCGDDDESMMGSEPISKQFRVTVENVGAAHDFAFSGSFEVPLGESAPGPIGPAQAYEFRIGATPGSFLSFATMFVQSNDLFYSPDASGIALFDGANPISGDVTDQLALWDSGTEANEEPGVGANQAPRQGSANTGPVDADATVRLVDDGYDYPAVSDVIQVTITYEGDNVFLVRIENVSEVGTLVTSTNEMLAVPLAPGVFVVHSHAAPLFEAGVADAGNGLEALAEDGGNAALAGYLAARSGLMTPFAPGAWAVHTANAPLFTTGAADRGEGLEALAEDGDPSAFAAALSGASGVAASGAFNTPVGAAGPGPIMSGQRYQFEFTAQEGDRLSFATMLVQSNDLFVSPDDDGIELFSSATPLSGDITSRLDLWDAGTEQNQWPGAGPDQAPRQSGPDTGAADGNTAVRVVDDGFAYPDVDEVVRVTIETL